MASVALIAWPYDAGLGDVGMGSGASMLLADEELHQGLSAGTDRVTVETVPPVDPALPEITRIFELDRRLARHVARARARGAFPLVLAGNCISALGTTAGVRDGERLGVVWLDAHADLDTPEDNLSGFTDVMGLSILTGGAWRALRATIPGFAPVGERDVVMAGVRDLEPYQRERLAGTEIAVVPGRVELESYGRGSTNSPVVCAASIYTSISTCSTPRSDGRTATPPPAARTSTPCSRSSARRSPASRSRPPR